jgi:hypothetical protein
VEVNHAVAKAMFVQQFKPKADVGWEGLRAASNDDRCEDQVILVDQARLDRLGGEIGAAVSTLQTEGRRFEPVTAHVRKPRQGQCRVSAATRTS